MSVAAVTSSVSVTAVMMRLPPGVPVLDVLHTSLDQQGQPYELTRFVMRADLTGLLYDVPVE